MTSNRKCLELVAGVGLFMGGMEGASAAIICTPTTCEETIGFSVSTTNSSSPNSQNITFDQFDTMGGSRTLTGVVFSLDVTDPTQLALQVNISSCGEGCGWSATEKGNFSITYASGTGTILSTSGQLAQDGAMLVNTTYTGFSPGQAPNWAALQTFSSPFPSDFIGIGTFPVNVGLSTSLLEQHCLTATTCSFNGSGAWNGALGVTYTFTTGTAIPTPGSLPLAAIGFVAAIAALRRGRS
jgi:hypothetical protein